MIRMLGLFYGILACLFWGTNYIVPCLLPTFSPEEILLGRYLAFGMVAILLRPPTNNLPNMKTVLLLALFGYLCYDFLDIVNIRIHSPESVALLYGIMLLMTPLVLKKQRPSLNTAVFLIGLFLLEWQEWKYLSHSPWGCLITIAQGGLWAYYTRSFAVYEESQTRSIITWVGIICFFISLLGWGYQFTAIYPPHASAEWFRFILVSFMSGIGYCWLASYFWCLASKFTPYNILNTLLLGDIIAGRLYGTLVMDKVLAPIHIVGMITLLIAGLPWKNVVLKLSRL